MAHRTSAKNRGLTGNPSGRKPKKRRGEGALSCPEYLRDDEAAMRKWDEVLPLLQKAGLSRKLDTDVLAAYCDTYSRRLRALHELNGLTKIVAKGGKSLTLVYNQLNGTVNKMAVLLRQLARELGMTPSARANIGADDPNETADDLDDFIKSGPGLKIAGAAHG